MTNPKTVAEFFAQYAEKGHVFDKPVRVLYSPYNFTAFVTHVLPDHVMKTLKQFGVDDPTNQVQGVSKNGEIFYCDIFGRKSPPEPHLEDITAIPGHGIDERGSDVS